eukprot:12656712-Heterocapsa_arctica.AAC.1
MRGIPVGKLRGFPRADGLIRQVGRLQAMGRLSIQAEYRKRGLPFDPELDDQGLVDRLRDVFVWQSLP